MLIGYGFVDQRAIAFLPNQRQPLQSAHCGGSSAIIDKSAIGKQFSPAVGQAVVENAKQTLKNMLWNFLTASLYLLLKKLVEIGLVAQFIDGRECF